VMPVPEATADQDDLASRWKHEVRGSGKGADVIRL
jgi:hypothetical protein